MDHVAVKPDHRGLTGAALERNRAGARKSEAKSRGAANKGDVGGSNGCTTAHHPANGIVGNDGTRRCMPRGGRSIVMGFGGGASPASAPAASRRFDAASTHAPVPPASRPRPHRSCASGSINLLTRRGPGSISIKRTTVARFIGYRPIHTASATATTTAAMKISAWSFDMRHIAHRHCVPTRTKSATQPGKTQIQIC
jgi:hypothetical protein